MLMSKIQGAIAKKFLKPSKSYEKGQFFVAILKEPVRLDSKTELSEVIAKKSAVIYPLDIFIGIILDELIL